MIGRQVNFYLTADDQNQLLAAIHREIGCALVIRNSVSSFHVKADLIRQDSDWAVAYLCDPSKTNVVLGVIRSGSTDTTEEIAIQFLQPVQQGGILRRGRFWYAPARAVEGTRLSKPKEFVDWAGGVFKITKRELHAIQDGDLIGPQARLMHHCGRLDLAI